MPEITLFCEDSFHEKFVGALIARLGRERDIAVGLRILSARGGLSRMQREFNYFLRDLTRDRRPLPDAIVVVLDANCTGYTERKKLMANALIHHPNLNDLVSYAIPDPHIERWMLADARAFQTVFGRGCPVPTIKCAKDEYERLLRQEIRDSGIEPPLGGEEYADEIVEAMDLNQVERREPSLGLFLRDFKALLNRWKNH